MSKSVRPKDLTDKISFGLTKNNISAAYFIVRTGEIFKISPNDCYVEFLLPIYDVCSADYDVSPSCRFAHGMAHMMNCVLFVTGESGRGSPQTQYRWNRHQNKTPGEWNQGKGEEVLKLNTDEIVTRTR